MCTEQPEFVSNTAIQPPVQHNKRRKTHLAPSPQHASAMPPSTMSAWSHAVLVPGAKSCTQGERCGETSALLYHLTPRPRSCSVTLKFAFFPLTSPHSSPLQPYKQCEVTRNQHPYPVPQEAVCLPMSTQFQA